MYIYMKSPERHQKEKFPKWQAVVHKTEQILAMITKFESLPVE